LIADIVDVQLVAALAVR